MSDYTGCSLQGETMLRTIHFDHPAWTPVFVGFLPACWMKYGDELDDVLLAHPRLFPNHHRPARREPPVLDGLLAAGRVKDCWGCVWENLHPGIIGQVVEHPLADWGAWDSWTPPDPLRDNLLGPRDWDRTAREIREKKVRGDFSMDFILPHGFHFLLMCDLRGFENVMIDMIEPPPEFDRLIDVMLRFDSAVADKFIELGTEFMGLAEDLGHQTGLPISLELWRKYVKPAYEVTAGKARDRGIPVFLHSDGHILPIIPELIETGVTVINPQLRPNGLQGLKDAVEGRMTICLDLDRQLYPFAKPGELAELVRQAHDTLGMPEGGLIFNLEISEDIPLANMHELFGAIETVCNLPDPETTGHASVGA
ncbi:MAG: hypothetical protein NTY46_10530 [Candidatus Sumerlaeota bacterium]|nr:hypothetical protein [Candidatus Sumerlaeota bacterium]